MHMCMHMRLCMCALTCACVGLDMCMCVHTHAHACTFDCVCVRAYTCACGKMVKNVRNIFHTYFSILQNLMQRCIWKRSIHFYSYSPKARRYKVSIFVSIFIGTVKLFSSFRGRNSELGVLKGLKSCMVQEYEILKYYRYAHLLLISHRNAMCFTLNQVMFTFVNYQACRVYKHTKKICCRKNIKLTRAPPKIFSVEHLVNLLPIIHYFH